MKNPYTILGLNENATEDDIKAAHRRLAAQWHPDREGGDAAKMQEVNGARDAILRGEWDRHKRESQAHHAPFTREFHFDNLDEMLRAFNASQRQRNRDLNAQCQLSLEDAFKGREITITVPDANGGRRDIRVMIPRGVETGNRIRVPGGGDSTFTGIPAGDLYVTIHVADHPVFARVGRNLVVNHKVDVFDALLGAKLMIRGIDGADLEVEMPPLLQPGVHLRVAGHGMPALHGGSRGDLLVTITLRLPETLSQEQQNLIGKAAGRTQVS